MACPPLFGLLPCQTRHAAVLPHQRRQSRCVVLVYPFPNTQEDCRMSPPAEPAGVNSFRANLGLVVHGQRLRTGTYTRNYERKILCRSEPETAIIWTNHR